MTVDRYRVVVVAPYCPAGRGGVVLLGGAAKQRAVLRGLAECQQKSLLVNSGHQTEGWRTGSVRGLRLPDLHIAELHPPTLPLRPLGKFLQCLLAPFIGYRLQRRYRPTLVWLYNSYLFEALYAWGARIADPGVQLVLELEDLPAARRRAGLGYVKILLDGWGLSFLSRRVDGATVVQESMRRALPSRLRRVWYMPVLLSDSYMKDFAPTGGVSFVGYFGELSVEKGVEGLLEIIRRSPGNCRWLICGAGELSKDIERLAREMPQRLAYLGAVDEAGFRRAYESVTAVVNLHKPLAGFSRGVFPYKILEAVAAGKITLSTDMDGCPIEVAGAIHWLKGDPVSSCLEALNRLPEIGDAMLENREEARRWVRANFTAGNAIRRILEGLSMQGNSSAKENDDSKSGDVS